jgi:hypothetical protein
MANIGIFSPDTLIVYNRRWGFRADLSDPGVNLADRRGTLKDAIPMVEIRDSIRREWRSRGVPLAHDHGCSRGKRMNR